MFVIDSNVRKVSRGVTFNATLNLTQYSVDLGDFLAGGCAGVYVRAYAGAISWVDCDWWIATSRLRRVDCDR